MNKKIQLVSATLLGVLAITFFMLFVNRLGMEYNSEGNYFDESTGVVYHEQSVSVFGIISVALLLITILAFSKVRSSKR